MKVLYVSTADDKYGAAKTQLDMILRLKEEYQVEPVVLTKSYNRFNELCDQIGIENYHYWYRDIMAGSAYSSSLLNFAKHVVKYLLYIRGEFSQKGIEKCGINMDEIDIIHSNHIRIDIGAYLANKYKKPHIWHIKELNQGHVKIRHYKPKCFQFINKNADAFIAVTKQVKEMWNQAGLEAEKIRVIYEGIDTKKYFPKAKREDELFKIVIVGRIEEAKGQLQVLEALTLLPMEIRNNIRVDLYGDAYPDYKNNLDRFIKKNNLANIVSFQGYSDKIPEVLTNYDAGILSSKGDAFGTVTAEYMAAGLLAIATYTELVEHMETGLRYEYGDVHKLAENILFAYQNRVMIQEIAERGRENIRMNYSIERNAYGVFSLYEDILGKDK